MRSTSFRPFCRIFGITPVCWIMAIMHEMATQKGVRYSGGRHPPDDLRTTVSGWFALIRTHFVCAEHCRALRPRIGQRETVAEACDSRKGLKGGPELSRGCFGGIRLPHLQTSL